MPTTRNVEPDPKPVGDPQPPKPEVNPVPTGDPKPVTPGSEPRSGGRPWTTTIWASRKVDDLSRHEARHDEPLTRKPNAREKPQGWVKPVGHGQPQDVQPTPELPRT
jgi:hypothetical protein